MNYEQQKDRAWEFFCKGLEIMASKANDYAQDKDVFSNFKKIADVCDIPTEKVFLVFMAVKIARLLELITKDNKVNESKQDSLLDIANYACLMAVYLDESKTKNETKKKHKEKTG